MMPYRVALCITDLDVGGAELALVELATRLDRTRFSPVVYCLGPRPQVAEGSCAAKLELAGIPVHCVGARRWSDALRATRQLAGRLSSQNAQLLQSFLFHANLVGRLAARLAGVPRVVAGIRVAERQAGWHLWLDRLTSRWVDRYVCVSQAVAEFSVSRGRLPRHRVVVIPNGVDLGRYPAGRPADLRRFGIPERSRVATFVGRLEHQKGVDWLLATAALWLPLVPDCHLLIVGRGPLLPRLVAQARQAGIADRVHFAGWQADVPEILGASNLLVLPSRWEGMPNVLLQAMASRLPVVATDVEGVRELLGEAPAQTVRFGDTEGFARRTAAILADHEMAAALGDANRKRADCLFSIERMVSSYERLWESLMGPAGGGEKEKSARKLGAGQSPQPNAGQTPTA